MISRANFIKPGKVVHFLGKPYRILLVNPEIVVLIEVGISKYHFETVDFDYLIAADPQKFYELEDIYAPKHVDLSEKQLEEITEKAKDIEKILNNIYPNYYILMSNIVVPEVVSFQAKYNLGPKATHKIIRRYLQSGRDMYSMVDMRGVNSGRHATVMDQTQEKYFEEAFLRFKSGQLKSVTAAYNIMLLDHYSTHVFDENGEFQEVKLLPKEQVPSEKKFRRYVKKQLGNLNVNAFKKGARERRNSDRIRYGNAQTGCEFPGDIVEIDACELDVIILSEEDRRHGIGRPVVYFAVDVYSACIIGYYVGFENNSFLGASSLFSNLFFEDTPHYREVEGMSRVNITPGGVIPNSIRVDQGSEWISKDMRRLGKECGIHVTIVPPAEGSMKGLVENSFHVYQEELGNLGGEFGAIYQAYESKHYKTASMILSNVKKTIENFVLMFNQKYRKKFKPTKDMIEKGINLVPCELWDYGIKYCGNPIFTTENRKQKLVFALCKPCEKDMRATLSMEGISVKGLKYISRDPRFRALMEKNHYSRKEVNYEVRYDPRLVDYIWVKIDGEVLQVPLAPKKENQMSYQGLTWFEYNIYHIDQMGKETAYKQIDKDNTLTYVAKTRQIMETSKKKRKLVPGKNDNKDISVYRKLEQENERRKSALAGQIEAPAQEYDLPEQIEVPETNLLEMERTDEAVPERKETDEERRERKRQEYYAMFAWEDED